jgi:hypothetical protein
MIDAQHAVGIGRGGAECRPMEPHQRYGEPAAGQPDALGHVSHDADLGVGVVVPGNEEDAVVGADVDGQRNRHARKHDCVVQGDDSKPVHSGTIVRLLVHFVNYLLNQV